MASINGKLKYIKVTPTTMMKAFLDDLAAQLDTQARAVKSLIEDDIKEYVYSVLRRSPTAKSLEAGSNLAYNFGLTPPISSQVVNDICGAVANSVKVSRRKIKRSGKRITGGFKVGIVLADYSDVLSVKNTEYDSINAKGEKTKVYWLKWLLFEGDKIVVSDYKIRYTLAKRSRSGSALMVKKKGGAYRVPPEFSGTENDNWLLREFSGIKEAEFVAKMQSIFAKYF